MNGSIFLKFDQIWAKIGSRMPEKTKMMEENNVKTKRPKLNNKTWRNDKA